MAEDIRQGFKESKARAKAVKTFTQVQKDYEGFIQNNTDRLQKKAENIQINLDSATISRKIKEKTSNSFEELIDLIGQTNTNPNNDFFINILKNQLQNLPTLIEGIIEECVFSSLNCSNEQTYLTNQELYIQVSEIDLFNQLKLSPDSSIGASIYEKIPYDPLASRRS